MVVFDYFEEVLEGIEYLIALGSIVGLFGFMIRESMVVSSKKYN